MANSLPDNVDVLVVGCGPVGAAMACLLGNYGIKTLIIDKASSIYKAPRAISLDNEALRILQNIGLKDSDFSKVVADKVLMHSPYFGNFWALDTEGTIDDHPKQVTFYQPELESVLRERISNLPCVALHAETTFLKLDNNPDGVSATLRGADGSLTTVKAKYLIGADGANSGVRSAIGLENTGDAYDEYWLIVDAVGVANNIDHIEFLCDPKRPTPHMVAPGGRTRWEFMLHPHESAEKMESDAVVKELLKPWSQNQEIKIERKAVYKFSAQSCERYSLGRTFLIGDAAHLTPPFAGQGLVSGLRDSFNLAWKLAWVLRGNAASQILTSYDQERRPHAKEMIKFATDLGRLIMPRSIFKALILHGLMKFIRAFKPIRAYLDSNGPKPKNAFKKGLFTPAKGKLQCGAAFPQFKIKSPQGELLRSDDLFGDGITLVVFSSEASNIEESLRERWQQIGGVIVNLAFEASTTLYSVHGDDPTLAKDYRAQCVVIRPDRTILEGGAVNDVTIIIERAIKLLTS